MSKNTKPSKALVKTDVSGSVILPTDLRIGNLVYDDENIVVKVEKIVSEMYQEWNGYEDEYCIEFSKIGDNNMFYSKVNPIPITEEWLIKFGFEKIIDNEFTLRYDLKKDPSFDYFFPKHNLKTFGLRFKGSTFFDVVKYVHQLQNFYFVLTGLELRVVL